MRASSKQMRGVENVVAKKKIMAITLESKVYLPGDTVRGEVSVNLAQRMALSSLRIRLCCKEWTDMRRPNEAGAGDIVAKQRLAIYKQLVTCEGTTKSTMHRLRDAVQTTTQSGSFSIGSMVAEPGQYCYPFEFTLPSWLPPTFCVKGDEEDFSSIVCFVKAYIDDPTTTATDADIVARQFFRVLAVMPRTQYARLLRSPLVVESKHSYRKYCCIEKTVAARLCAVRIVRLDTDAALAVRIEVLDPDGGVAGVRVRLVHTLEVTTQGHRETRVATISSVQAELLSDPTLFEIRPVLPRKHRDAEGTRGSPHASKPKALRKHAAGESRNPLEADATGEPSSTAACDASSSNDEAFHVQFPAVKDGHRIFAARLPLSRDLTPTVDAILTRSFYQVVAELSLPMATSDASLTVAPILTHVVNPAPCFKPVLYFGDEGDDTTCQAVPSSQPSSCANTPRSLSKTSSLTSRSGGAPTPTASMGSSDSPSKPDSKRRLGASNSGTASAAAVTASAFTTSDTSSTSSATSLVQQRKASSSAANPLPPHSTKGAANAQAPAATSAPMCMWDVFYGSNEYMYVPPPNPFAPLKRIKSRSDGSLLGASSSVVVPPPPPIQAARSHASMVSFLQEAAFFDDDDDDAALAFSLSRSRGGRPSSVSRSQSDFANSLVTVSVPNIVYGVGSSDAGDDSTAECELGDSRLAENLSDLLMRSVRDVQRVNTSKIVAGFQFHEPQKLY